ncbi:MAG: DUF2905 domain-containing protein [Syntrophomonadaceae bacterium]|nr:DUF2905 domain-containing protein [Syntrophomonadaceae bacterium]
MSDWTPLARLIIGIGIGLVVLGLLMLGAGRLFPFGRLPGDIYIQKGNFTVYFPLVSMLILSLLLSLVLNLFSRR